MPAPRLTMKKTTLLLLLSITVLCSHGQPLDSLYMAYKNAKSTERRAHGKSIVAWLDDRNLLTDSILLDNKLSDAVFERTLLHTTVRYLFRSEYYDLAYDAANTLRKLSELANDTVNLIHSSYFMGFSCQRMGKMDEGLVHAKACYDLCLAYHDQESLSSVMNNIANIYQVNYQDSLAIFYFRKTIDIERTLGRMQNLATRLGNISTSYLRSGQLEEALSSVTEGLELDRKEGRPDKIAIRLYQMSEVYLAMNHYEQAKECAFESLDYFISADSGYGQSLVLQMIGNVERELKNHHQAEKYYLQALSFAENLQNDLLVQRISNELYVLYRENNHTQSLFYFERSVALRDSLFHKENQLQLNDFRIKYETAEKQLQIERQQTEISRQKSRQYILWAGLSVAAALLVLLVYIVALRTRRNRELANANATKDKFFSIISHDLKNPAIAQRNAIQLLLEHSGTWDAASLALYYQKLLKSANGQVDLLFTLLSWAQLQTGRMPFHPAQFDLVAALQPCIDIVRSMAEDKGITLNIHTPDTAIVTGDYNMLATVVRNLLGNAIKFTSTPGEVSLSITPATHSSQSHRESITTHSSQSHQGSLSPRTGVLHTPPSRYLLSITDTGTGISPLQLETLFDLDRPHPRTGTSGETGSGLGLIICKELLQKHNTQLHVESKEGKGSCFRFEI